MTVAAVVLAASAESALADADGLPRVRRIADTAWAGGALPIVVVAPDPDGRVAAALAGAQVTLAEPGPPEAGPVGQIRRGIDVAAAEVRETTAALIWPACLCWVGAETVTSLIEAHGAEPRSLLRPSFGGEAGWPAVLPMAYRESLRELPADLMPDEILAAFAARHAPPQRLVELGDPGTVIDGGTARSALPPYEGPAIALSGHAHEWGAAVADIPDDAPAPGPSIARFDPT